METNQTRASLEFKKFHGLGNDFILVDCRDGTPVPSREAIRKMADRNCGIGFDQAIHILHSRTPEADVFMDMYNADGSSIEACGNATRCVASLLMRETRTSSCRIQTVAGILECSPGENGMITADMGPPRLDWQQIPLARACDTHHLPLDQDPVAVNMGNPHCVFFVKDLTDFPLADAGPKIENHPLFPERTNVEYVQILDRTHLRMRVWERGTGITRACGSGACAVAVAAVLRGLAEREVRITLDGGDLFLKWCDRTDHVFMTGPATHVFDGMFFGAGGSGL